VGKHNKKTQLGEHTVIATIAVHDLENAKDFYSNILGLNIAMETAAAITFESGGGMFGVYESNTAGSGLSTSAWWKIDAVEDMVAELKAKGVHFEHYDDMPGTVRKGDIHINGDMKGVWFKDIDGNILGFGNY
jgi:catechol-2,3-dioxygenase